MFVEYRPSKLEEKGTNATNSRKIAFMFVMFMSMFLAKTDVIKWWLRQYVKSKIKLSTKDSTAGMLDNMAIASLPAVTTPFKSGTCISKTNKVMTIANIPSASCSMRSCFIPLEIGSATT